VIRVAAAAAAAQLIKSTKQQQTKAKEESINGKIIGNETKGKRNNEKFPDNRDEK